MQRSAPGHVRAEVLRAALPSMAAMLLSAAGTFADALFLSRAGAQASAAAGAAFPLLCAVQTIGFTLGMGSGSAVSRLCGSGDTDLAQRCAGCALLSALLLGGALSAIGLGLHAPLLRLLGAPAESAAEAAAYTRSLLLAAPLICLSLTLSSLLRGLGRTMPSLAAYGGGALAGTALCWYLSVVRGMGAAGAGIALLAREGITALVLAGAALRLLPRVSLSAVRGLLPLCVPRLFVLREIMRSGLPTLLRQGAMSAGSLLLTRACTAFGAEAVGGMGLAVRSGVLLSSAVIGFGQGFQPVCGRAIGAGDADRVRAAYRFCMRCVVLSLLAAGALLFPAAGMLLALTGAPEEIVSFGAAVLRAQALTLPAQGAVIMMTMLTQAAGLPVRATLVSASRQGLFLIPLVLLLPRMIGRTGLVLCQAASDLISLPFCWLLTRSLLQHMPLPRRNSHAARD